MTGHFEVLTALLPQTKGEVASESIGFVAMSSPLWLPWLKEVSEISGLLVPIAGFLLIVCNIVARYLITRRILREPVRLKDHEP